MKYGFTKLELLRFQRKVDNCWNKQNIRCVNDIHLIVRRVAVTKSNIALVVGCDNIGGGGGSGDDGDAVLDSGKAQQAVDHIRSNTGETHKKCVDSNQYSDRCAVPDDECLLGSFVAVINVST